MNLVVLALFTVVGWSFDGLKGVSAGALSYVVISQLLRRIICRRHRRAISLCQRGHFEQAIPEFQQSLQFFRNNVWIDQFRGFTLLSCSAFCYREMALVSLGFCYGQLSDAENARINYEECLK